MSHGNSHHSRVPQRVLVVDDDRRILKILEAYLQWEGYDVALAAGGAEALEVVPRYRPDALILDLMMPDIDGFEVCRRLRANTTTSNLPILVLTAMKRPEAEAEAAGADRCIAKPFGLDDVGRQLKELFASA